MVENWIELMELAKSRNEAILREVQNVKIYEQAIKEAGGHNPLVNHVMGGLGKAFSSIGDSLQEHYRFDSSSNRNPLKKVS